MTDSALLIVSGGDILRTQYGRMYQSNAMNLSVVLPCYNEEENAAMAVLDVYQWMRENGVEGEIIAVDDGSKDGTFAVLDALRQDIANLKIVRHERNGGYGVAVRSGCDSAQTEWIAFMDSDGQFHARDISLLIAYADNYAFVTGRRIKRADPFIRNVFGKLLGFMNFAVLGLWVRDVNCGMKLFKKDIWKEIRPEHGVEKLFNTEVFLRLRNAGIPWKQVDVPHYPRTAGKQTGGSVRVIIRMFKELLGLRRTLGRGRKASTSASFAGTSQEV